LDMDLFVLGITISTCRIIKLDAIHNKSKIHA
jgi:hypothetical protein